MKQKRILLLSPYDVASHRYWWQGLQNELTEFDWTVLTLPPRYFSWRIRGNSLSWAYLERESLEQDYDLLIACSLTDLSSLRGFVPKLASIPTLVYCHENQFVFPENPEQAHKNIAQQALAQQVIQIYNFECADKILFNSAYNRNTCLKGINTLLKKLPDFVPKTLFSNIEHKSAVLPVLLNKETINSISKSERFSLVWNHRWEYDKGLDNFLALIYALLESDIDCQIHVLGQSFRTIPDAMQTVKKLLKNEGMAGHIGFIENRRDYLALLASSHLVLSTSLHEFQGIAIMEAVERGCIPVLPNRLSYPEFFEQDYLYQSYSDTANTKKESEAALQLVKHFYELWLKKQLPDTSNLIEKLPSWDNKKAAYQEQINNFF